MASAHERVSPSSRPHRLEQLHSPLFKDEIVYLVLALVLWVLVAAIGSYRLHLGRTLLPLWVPLSFNATIASVAAVLLYPGFGLFQPASALDEEGFVRIARSDWDRLLSARGSSPSGADAVPAPQPPAWAEEEHAAPPPVEPRRPLVVGATGSPVARPVATGPAAAPAPAQPPAPSAIPARVEAVRPVPARLAPASRDEDVDDIIRVLENTYNPPAVTATSKISPVPAAPTPRAGPTVSGPSMGAPTPAAVPPPTVARPAPTLTSKIVAPNSDARRASPSTSGRSTCAHCGIPLTADDPTSSPCEGCGQPLCLEGMFDAAWAGIPGHCPKCREGRKPAGPAGARPRSGNARGAP
ncbi:MAG TPA: hypothetical protein VGV89_05090 [Thermoplasmata archaeon]|nr:hypothetical protein [Thermoplasmata archaeon]